MKTPSQFAHAAEYDAERLVLFGSYLSLRANGFDHVKAVKKANVQLVKVRRAMGYSYPKSGTSLF